MEACFLIIHVVIVATLVMICSLPYVCSMDTVLQALVEATEDCDREPWLELLAAMATKQW